MMMNDLEELFNKQPPLSEEDLTRLISAYREQRANVEKGYKAAKAVTEKVAAVDLSKLGLSKPKPTGGGIKIGGKRDA
jgi:hypothetical protein